VVLRAIKRSCSLEMPQSAGEFPRRHTGRAERTMRNTKRPRRGTRSPFLSLETSPPT
jgi:hypothetical protein